MERSAIDRTTRRHNANLAVPQLSEEQALVYVETIKTMLESVEKEEEDEIREILLQRKLEEVEREDALRSLLRRGDFCSFAKEGWSGI